MIASWQESNDEPRQCVEKQQHYSADKGPYSLGYGLPSGCESWTVKKAEHQRIDASELWNPFPQERNILKNYDSMRYILDYTIVDHIYVIHKFNYM